MNNPYTLKQVFYILILGVVFFLTTRLFNLLAFPIFNDESFFIHYAQLIHVDPLKNLYVSINRNEWKPPFSFWVLGLLMNDVDDPLWQARIMSVMVVLIGWGALSWFAYKLFGRQEAFWAAILYIFSAYCWFYDRTFLTEPFVFTTGMLVLLCTLYLITEKVARKKVLYLVLLTIFGSIALLTKHAGLMYLYILPAFLLLDLGSKPVLIGRLIQNALYLAFAFAGSQVAFRWAIPDKYFQINDFLREQWTVRFSELFTWRATVWKGVLSSMLQHMTFFHGRLFIALFTICLMGVAIHMTYALYRENGKATRDGILLLLVLGLHAILILGLRNPTIEERHYYPIFALNLLVLSRAFSLLGEPLVRIFRGIKFGKKLATASLILIIFTLYGVPSMTKMWIFLKEPEYSINEGDYGYFHYIAGWPSGFRIPEIIEHLKGSQPGILLVDPQLGNPGSALEVYKGSYPQLATFPLTSRNLKLLTDQQNLFERGVRVIYLVFENGSTSLQRSRKWRQELESSPQCSDRLEFARRDNLSHINLCSNLLKISR